MFSCSKTMFITIYKFSFVSDKPQIRSVVTLITCLLVSSLKFLVYGFFHFWLVVYWFCGFCFCFQLLFFVFGFCFFVLIWVLFFLLN